MTDPHFASTPDALQARFLIEQTIYRYSWLWDLEACEDIGSVFTEDVVGHLGGAVFHGRVALAEQLVGMRQELHPAGTVSMHRNTNILFHELTPTHAHTTTYAAYYVRLPDTQRYEYMAGGVYDDLHVPGGDTWLIEDRNWKW